MRSAIDLDRLAERVAEAVERRARRLMLGAAGMVYQPVIVRNLDYLAVRMSQSVDGHCSDGGRS
jgi:hypothetical protein